MFHANWPMETNSPWPPWRLPTILLVSWLDSVGLTTRPIWNNAGKTTISLSQISAQSFLPSLPRITNKSQKESHYFWPTCHNSVSTCRIVPMLQLTGQLLPLGSNTGGIRACWESTQKRIATSFQTCLSFIPLPAKFRITTKLVTSTNPPIMPLKCSRFYSQYQPKMRNLRKSYLISCHAPVAMSLTLSKWRTSLLVSLLDTPVMTIRLSLRGATRTPKNSGPTSAIFTLTSSPRTTVKSLQHSKSSIVICPLSVNSWNLAKDRALSLLTTTFSQIGTSTGSPKARWGSTKPPTITLSHTCKSMNLSQSKTEWWMTSTMVTSTDLLRNSPQSSWWLSHCNNLKKKCSSNEQNPSEHTYFCLF